LRVSARTRGVTGNPKRRLLCGSESTWCFWASLSDSPWRYVASLYVE